MQNNAVRYIHARRQAIVFDAQNFFGRVEKIQKGGMTFAWLVTDDNNIHVSVPAVCRDDDMYVRNAGAGISRQNLNEKDVLFSITREELIEDSAKVYSDTLSRIGDVSAAAIVELTQAYRTLLSTLDLVRSLTPHFFEEMIRSKLREIYKNKPYAI